MGKLMGQGDTSGGGAAQSLSSSYQFQIPASGLLLPDPTTPEMLRKAKSLSNKYQQCGVLLPSSKELGKNVWKEKSKYKPARPVWAPKPFSYQQLTLGQWLDH